MEFEFMRNIEKIKKMAVGFTDNKDTTQEEINIYSDMAEFYGFKLAEIFLGPLYNNGKLDGECVQWFFDEVMHVDALVIQNKNTVARSEKEFEKFIVIMGLAEVTIFGIDEKCCLTKLVPDEVIKYVHSIYEKNWEECYKKVTSVRQAIMCKKKVIIKTFLEVYGEENFEFECKDGDLFVVVVE